MFRKYSLLWHVIVGICIVAGASGFGWKRLTLSAAIGSLPPAVIYAYAGSMMEDNISDVFRWGSVN